MKKVESLLRTIGIDKSVIGIDKANLCKDLIQEYARNCAQKALNDAAESEGIEILTTTEWLNIGDSQLIKDIIISTEIKTP